MQSLSVIADSFIPCLALSVHCQCERNLFLSALPHAFATSMHCGTPSVSCFAAGLAWPWASCAYVHCWPSCVHHLRHGCLERARSNSHCLAIVSSHSVPARATVAKRRAGIACLYSVWIFFLFYSDPLAPSPLSFLQSLCFQFRTILVACLGSTFG